MVPFKPAEIRIITLLAILAIAGTLIELARRQDIANRLDLGIFPAQSQYPYQYNAASFAHSETETTQIERFASIPDAEMPQSKIDINHCGYFDLERLPGIGPALAENIIAFRDSIGGFRAFDELDKIKGIGPAKLAMLKDRIVFK